MISTSPRSITGTFRGHSSSISSKCTQIELRSSSTACSLPCLRRLSRRHMNGYIQDYACHTVTRAVPTKCCSYQVGGTVPTSAKNSLPGVRQNSCIHVWRPPPPRSEVNFGLIVQQSIEGAAHTRLDKSINAFRTIILTDSALIAPRSKGRYRRTRG